MKKLLLLVSTFLFLFFYKLVGQVPVYDTCSAAQPVPPHHLGSVCVGNIDYTNNYSTPSVAGTVPIPSCGNFTDGITSDVWFTFTLSGTASVTIKIDSGTTPSAQDLSMAVYSSSSDCSGLLTLVACDDNSNIIMPLVYLPNAAGGINYYIRVWSNNGTQAGNFRICSQGSPVGIDELTNENSFTIFPNPTQNIFTIKLSSEMKNAVANICDILGKKVYSTAINKREQTINNTLPSGIYFVKITDREKQFVEKLIVQ